MVRLFSLSTFLLVTSIFIGIYHKQILKYAVENFDICQKTEEPEAPKEQETPPESKKDTSVATVTDKPKYWLIGDNADVAFGPLKTVLERVGLEQFNGTLKTENNNEGWNLIWSTKSNIPLNWKGLKFHQKFNHFPWSKMLSSKSLFASKTDSKFVPKGFLDSEELKKYAKANPKKKFLKKSKTRGGISYVKDVKKLNFTSDDDFYVQELVQNPLLFDGRKFELSIYVVITSIAPLRLYYFDQNVFPRFCPEEYDHSDFSDSDTYVVGDSHVTPMDFEGTREYFLNGYTFKDAIENLLRKQNASVEDTWRKIEDVIRNVVVSKEKDFIEYVS